MSEPIFSVLSGKDLSLSFAAFYTASGSASSEYSVSGEGTGVSPLVAVIGGNDNNINRLWIKIEKTGTLSWQMSVSSEEDYDWAKLFRTTAATPSQHTITQALPPTITVLSAGISGNNTESGNIGVVSGQFIILQYQKDGSVAGGTDNATLTMSIN
jgi:hypothetical protein